MSPRKSLLLPLLIQESMKTRALLLMKWIPEKTLKIMQK
jgi:hypothetical protein